ncbi:MAG: thiD [Verrucomicrobiales bacterium]|nr:thiD [Verrucomicrobiales bacterium]
MLKRKTITCALTIAGSDSGGGAGIQADLKTFAAIGVHGTSVLTCITAQNPRRVIGVQEITPKLVRQQLEAVFEALPPHAIKTGMLFSKRIIQEVTRFLRTLKKAPPLIVDPVMMSTSGSLLLQRNAIKALTHELFRLAALITPNIPEAEALGAPIVRDPEDLRIAVRHLHDLFGCAVLLKGGHLGKTKESVDIFYDGKTELLLSAPRIQKVKNHGTGCTYSAAITGYMANGDCLESAVERGKDFVTHAIAGSVRVAQQDLLSWVESADTRSGVKHSSAPHSCAHCG